MGLRPRTARRLALVASLLVLLVGGGVAFFTIPKLQNARQMRSFLREGMEAHQEGRHSDAVTNLGRFLRAMRDQPVEPEVRLAFARSRTEWEAANGGHLPAAIAVYREYLREKPEDREVSVELLDLFVRTGAWTEARDLAVRLRPSEIASVPDDQLEILRHEWDARMALNASDPLILSLEDRLLSAQVVAFGDVWRAFSRSERAENDQRSADVLETYALAQPDSTGSRFLNALYGAKGFDLKDRVRVASQALDLDPVTVEFVGDATFDSPELVRLAVSLFETSGRVDLAIKLLERGLDVDPAEFTTALARRLYWSGRFDEVLERAQAGMSSANSDLLGYAAFVAQDRKDEVLLGNIEEELFERKTEYRAVGWLKAIEARRELAAGDAVGARTRATAAIDQYALEPTFRFLMGDIHDRTGRLADALEAWSIAEDLAQPAIWPQPGIRKVSALMRAGQLVEAGDAAARLMDRNPFDVSAVVVRVQTDSVLARSGLLNADRLRQSLMAARFLRDNLSKEGDPGSSLNIASLEAALGNADAARAELAMVMGTNPGASIRNEALNIDRAYGLGMATQLGPIELPDHFDDPEVGLRTALYYVGDATTDDEAERRTLSAIEVLDAGTAAADPAAQPSWLRAGAAFRDVLGRESASVAWRSAIEADPANVSLLTEAIESNALGYDTEFVQQSIDKIVELTATQGRTLPSRLRLARARSIFGRAPTKQRRDEAISIVRAVVVAEPQSIAARTLLANMLAFPCPPSVQGNDRFTPDFAGAIEQNLAVASLIPGAESFVYMFNAARLHITAGNETQARQVLLDLLARARGDAASQERIALELARIGDNQTANRLLGELFASGVGSSKASIGLQLAQTAIAASDQVRAQSVLREVVAVTPMSMDQLADLAGKLRKVGLEEEAEQVLENAEYYELNERDALLVRARVADASGDAQLAIRLLTQSVDDDPNDADTWIALIELLIRRGDREEAAAQADRAIAVHPENDTLQYWKQIALNDPAAAIRIMTERPGTDEALKLAIKRVEDYDSRSGTLNREQRIAELRDLANTFPNYPAVMKFVLRQRFELADDIGSIADSAIAASRRFVGDEDILRMAADATFASGRFAESARIATEWRGRTRGSPMQPDLYAAQAAQALGNHAAVLERLEPYINSAVSSPDEGAFPTLLRLYGSSALKVRTEPAVRARFEPIARQSEQFRETVWIDLAATEVQPGSSAADWLRLAEQLGVPGSEIRLVDAWMMLAQRIPQSGVEFAKNAVRVSGATIDSRGEDARTVEAAGRARLLWAEFLPEDQAEEAFAQAETFFVRASQLDRSDPSHRLQAAGAASRAGRPNEAERYYREILEDPTVRGFPRAIAQNNLAGLLSLVDPNPQRLQDADQLVQSAIEGVQTAANGNASLQPLATRMMSAFQGTRGWVLLGLGRSAEAVSVFQEVTQIDSRSIEAWAGLSIALRENGNPPEQVDQAWNEAQKLKGTSGPITEELQRRLTAAGVVW